MTKLFKIKTVEDQANSLAQFFPEGRAFCSRNESTSNFRKFINGLAAELQRVYNSANNLSEDYDINLTVELISNWESAVGIPDNCFPGTGTIEERRSHVLLKLAKMNVQTAADFIALGEALGFSGIVIVPLRDLAFPPYDVPFLPTSAPGSRYIVFVQGTDIVTGVPPYDVPFTPQAQASSILQCVFDKVKPANVRMVYQNV